MLERLKISNFVLIPELEIDLESGMTVITGETGSGKSILLGAISLILGAKADREEIRAGEEKAELEAVFFTKRKSLIDYLDEKGIDPDGGHIIIRRQIRSSGRSLYSVNGSSITLSEGQEIGRMLVDLTSQNSSMFLKKREMQRSLLDSAEDIARILSRYQQSYSELLELKRKREEAEEKIRKVEEDRAFIEYSLEELEKAELKAGEDDEIKEKLKIASESEYLVENLGSVRDALDSSSRTLSQALMALGKARNKDASLDEYYTRLESASIETDDLLETIASKISTYSFDEYEMEEMNSRLALLQRIRKKYGGSIESAIQKRDEMKSLLLSGDEDLAALDKLSDEIAKKEREVILNSDDLHSARLKRAQKLSASITETLRRLSMESARFVIDVAKTEPGPYGADVVSFLIEANKGEKMSDLESAASGGELSRIMLAVKSSFFLSDDTETLIFDEVDTGISGHAASNVAAVMKELSSKSQIIAITHLAQIASKADSHLLVSKSLKKGRTVSSLRYIEGDEKVREIARLLSGDESEISLEHAKTLIGS